MSSISWTRRKERQENSTIWNYDNCYHTCSSSFNNNNNNIEYGNGGQNEKCSHSSTPVPPRLGLFCTSTTLLRSNECSTLTKTITHQNIFQHHVTSNFVTLVMKNLLAPMSSILSVASVIMNNKLFVKFPFQVLLCIFMLLCCSTTVFGSPVASAGPGPLAGGSGSSLQQSGGLSPFPEGRGPDGTLYKTDYRCEGENMTVTCEGSDGPGRHGAIRVVRANFGRFSIAICNRHGTTDWNVNCFAPQTTKTLQQRCDGKTNCVVAVDSTSFHDACPGTHKYLEIHYACQSRSQEAIPSEPKSPRRPKPALPPWIPSSDVKEAPRGPKVRVPKGPSAISAKSLNVTKNRRNGAEAKPVVEKVPILVTARATVDNNAVRRVPITTPSTTTSTTTTGTTRTTSKIIKDNILERNPKNRNDQFKKERSGLPNIPSGTIKKDSRKKPQFDTSRTRNEFPKQSSGTRKNIGIDDSSIKSGASNDGRMSQTLNKPSSDIKCPPTTSRQLQWDWTPAGQEAMQLCPIGAIGLAKWSCVMQDDSSARWLGSQPDMSGCKSVAVDNLEAQVRKEDPETVLVSSLAYLTRTRSLYGGDLESTVKIMREVASRLDFRLKSTSGSFHNKEAHVKQVVQDVLRAATHILEDSNRKAWWDLSGPTRLKVATDLLLALEENAFLLAGVVNEPSEILETHEIMTMAISVVDVSGRMGRHSRIGGGSGLYNVKEDNNDRYRKDDNNIYSPNSIIFPNKRLLFVDDSIELSKKDLADNSKEGLAEAVFFSYASLHEIMSSINDGEDHESMTDAGLSPIMEEMRLNDEFTNEAKEGYWKLNSRVISAALGSGRHIELSHPVTIELRHLNEENMTEPVCVFWDYERHGWSGSGCRVVGTNDSITTCQCDHLTSFAVLMREVNDDVVKNTMALNVRLDIIAYIVVSVVAVAILIAAIKYRRQIFEYCSCCCQNGLGFRHSGVGSKSCLRCLCCFSRSHSNKKQSHLEKCQSFYTGLSSQNHSQYVLTGQHLQAQNLLQCNGAGTLQHTSNPQQGYPSYHGNTICGGLLIGNGVNNMPTSGHNLGAGNIATMSAIAAGKNSRPHITLNPYSTQLVDNINMMMPNNNGSTTSSSNSNDSSGTNRIGKSITANNSSASNSSSSTASTTLGRHLLNPQVNNNLMYNPQLNTLTNTLRGGSGMPISDNSNIQVDQDFSQATNGEVVYRAVSPHGHVYWEIDPGQVYAATLAANNPSAQQVHHQQQQLSEENVALLVANQNNINFQPMQHHNSGMNNQQNLSDEEVLMHQLQQQQYCHPEMRPLINQVSTPAPLQCNVGTLVQQHAQPGMIMVNSSTPSNNGYNGATTLDFRTNTDNSSTNRSSAFVRNRFKQLPATSRRGKQQQIVSSVSSPLSPNTTGVDSINTNDISTSNTTNNITETLQTQVQIRDIKPIQGITVKSSEYIEAKIRTLRKNNNNILSHQNSGNQASRN